jgi:hypothetical protein
VVLEFGTKTELEASMVHQQLLEEEKKKLKDVRYRVKKK